MAKARVDYKEIEEFLDEAFEANFNLMKEESGRSITPQMKELARQHVLLYWRRLKGIAEKVTETEVKLVLPEQRTPNENKKYTLEGVVDIVREDSMVIMYDLKTRDADEVRAHPDDFAAQLNIYAHIWQNLRGQPLDKVAIIATGPPDSLREAWFAGKDREITKEMKKWNPVVNIPFDQSQVDKCIEDFGCTVEKIENGVFCSPGVAVLMAPDRPGSKTPFGTAICRHCDARFSCDDYWEFHEQKQLRKRRTSPFNFYRRDLATGEETVEWMEASVDSVTGTEIDENY